MQKVWDIAPTCLLSLSNCFKITYKVVLASINCRRDCIQILTHFLDTPAKEADRRFHCRIHTTHCLGDRPYAYQGQTSRQDYYFANKYLFFVRIQSPVGTLGHNVTIKNIYRYFTYNQEIKIAQTEVGKCRERRLTLPKRNTKESDFDKHGNHQNSLRHLRLR